MKKNTDKHYMRLALAAADRGVAKGQTPFGACIVKNRKVVVTAHNVVWKTTDITAHAEINAIRLACKKLKTIDLSGCVIYSTCEPCPMCFAACHWARIDKIIHGTFIRDASLIGFNELAISNNAMKHQGKSLVKIKGGFMRKENKALFQRWAQGKSKRAY
ncbi:MAG: nucleoside deaminase [Candidatus Omnitrophica bacterium]|nr:nucleoside deaminase [Candidatus Omnitrophota bacterium]